MAEFLNEVTTLSRNLSIFLFFSFNIFFYFNFLDLYLIKMFFKSFLLNKIVKSVGNNSRYNMILFLFALLVVFSSLSHSLSADIYLIGKVNLPADCRTVVAYHTLQLHQEDSKITGTITINPWFCRIQSFCNLIKCTQACLFQCNPSDSELDSILKQKFEMLTGSVTGTINGNVITMTADTDEGEFNIIVTISLDNTTGKISYSGQINSKVTCEPGVYVSGGISGEGIRREKPSVPVQQLNKSAMFISGNINLPVGCRYLVSHYTLTLSEENSNLVGTLNAETWHCRANSNKICSLGKCDDHDHCIPICDDSDESVRDSVLKTETVNLNPELTGKIINNVVTLTGTSLVDGEMEQIKVTGTISTDSNGKLTFSGYFDTPFTCEPGVVVKGSMTGTGIKNENVKPITAKLGDKCNDQIKCSEGICYEGICVPEPKCAISTTQCGGSCCLPTQSCDTSIGKCVPLFCNELLTQCGYSCTNTSFDVFNCGSCGNACGEGQKCADGRCVPINVSYVKCSGNATGTDMGNWNVQCFSGQCMIADSSFNYSGTYTGRFESSQDRGTVEITINPDGSAKLNANSEVYGDRIEASGSLSGSFLSMTGTYIQDGETISVFVSGECTPPCPKGYVQVGASCISLNGRDNCGIIGNQCKSNEICSNGKCVSCGIEETVCNNECVNLKDDSNNCGQCAKKCDFGKFCSNGTCIPSSSCVLDSIQYLQCGKECCAFTQWCDTTIMKCIPSLTKENESQCGSSTVDLSSDPNNCGVCFNKCNADEVCDNGKCVIPEICGNRICGVNESCSTCPEDCGSCIETGCNEKYPDLCEDKCVNLINDSLNCGVCGASCANDQFCNGGICIGGLGSKCNDTDNCAYGYCINNICQLKNCKSDSDCGSSEYCNQNLGVCDGGCRTEPDNCVNLTGQGVCNSSSRECIKFSCPAETVLINQECYSLTEKECNQSSDCGSGICYNNKCVSEEQPAQSNVESVKIGRSSFGESRSSPQLFLEKKRQVASDSLYSLFGISKTKLLAYDKCLRGSLCSSSDDCCGAPCLGSRCACSNSICTTTADCCSGYCENGRCASAPTTSLFFMDSLSGGVSSQIGCSGLIDECSPIEGTCVSLCNGLTMLLLLVSAGFGVYTWLHYKHPVAGLVGGSMPVIIGLATYPFVGIVIGIIMFALLASRSMERIERVI